MEIKMSNKIGRNEPCTCGSNKKYKKCCMNNDASLDLEKTLDFLWHKLRKMEGKVIDKHLLPYLKNELPEEMSSIALADFCLEDLPEEIDRELIFNNFFIPWLLFNWIPEEDFGVQKFDSQKTIAQNYIATSERNLSSEVMHFIEAMNQTYYSFYSVQEVVLEKYLVVKDILLGIEHTIKEKLATRTIKRGNILFGRILTLDNQSIFVGMAPYIIPVGYHGTLLDYKKWLIEENENQGLNSKILREYSVDELVNYFFEIIVERFNQPSPTLLNTDGDPIIFSKSYFKLRLSPAEVLHKLLSLTLSKDPDEFLNDAERDSSSKVTKIDFPWLKKGNKKHKNWDNTVMGNIIVEENKLILETNSEKRTELGKKILSKHLGDDIMFQQTLLETPEQRLKSVPDITNHNEEESKLLASPEVQEQLKQMAKAHWENWFDEKIPALDYKTPREAAKTKDGKERLEALLMGYEHYEDGKRNQINPFKADINYLKKKLGLL